MCRLSSLQVRLLFFRWNIIQNKTRENTRCARWFPIQNESKTNPKRIQNESKTNPNEAHPIRTSVRLFVAKRSFSSWRIWKCCSFLSVPNFGIWMFCSIFQHNLCYLFEEEVRQYICVSIVTIVLLWTCNIASPVPLFAVGRRNRTEPKVKPQTMLFLLKSRKVSKLGIAGLCIQ